MHLRLLLFAILSTFIWAACGDKNPVEEYGDTMVNALDKAEMTTLKVNMRTIKMEVERFKAEKGRLPESLEELNLPNIPLSRYQYNPDTGEIEINIQE